MSESNNVTSRYMSRDASGNPKQVEVQFNLTDYQAAMQQGKTLRDYINSKLSTGKDAADHSFGEPFLQVCQSLGFYPKANPKAGLLSPTINQMFSGQPPMAAGLSNTTNSVGTVVSPGGNDGSVAGRFFYPEIIMDAIRSALQRDNSDVEQIFDSMIAVTTSIGGGHYVQPIINYDLPEGEDSQASVIGQDAEPVTMLSISASSRANRIATKSIGLRITDEASNYASLDLVTAAVTAQTRGERIRMVENDIKGIFMGDADNGMSPLAAKGITAFDSSITPDGETVSQKAFLHILHDEYQKRSLNAAIMDLDTYLAYEGRSGRPIVREDNAQDGRVNADIRPANLMVGNVPVLLIKNTILGAGMAGFMDTRFAMHKVINVLADYEAVESFVLRRAKAMRFDYGQHTTRLYDEAFELVDLNS